MRDVEKKGVLRESSSSAARRVPVCHTVDTDKKISALLKLQTFKKAGERKKEGGEAPQGIEPSDIPVKCTGIKPGVKPTILFRLDAAKQRAIWQNV